MVAGCITTRFSCNIIHAFARPEVVVRCSTTYNMIIDLNITMHNHVVYYSITKCRGLCMLVYVYLDDFARHRLHFCLSNLVLDTACNHVEFHSIMILL